MGMWNAAVDIAAARARGIAVCGTAGGDAEATPALTWGLILALTRGIATEAASVRAGGWQVGMGSDIAGKTLGILGLGKIGGRLAQFGRTFGMEVIAWSPNLTAAAASEAGAERVDKDALFQQADVLTIHLKLGERSRGLVGARELGLMRPDAFLVNTSRGPIVDEAALIAALTERRIAGAALDVFDTEPLPVGHPFRHLPNVLATPHIGYVSRKGYEAAFPQMVEDIAAWRGGSADPGARRLMRPSQDHAASRMCCMACTTSAGCQGLAMKWTWSGRPRPGFLSPEVTITPICGQWREITSARWTPSEWPGRWMSVKTAATSVECSIRNPSASSASLFSTTARPASSSTDNVSARRRASSSTTRIVWGFMAASERRDNSRRLWLTEEVKEALMPLPST